MFFVALFPEKQLVITQTDAKAEYYVNGETDKLRFGVVGNGNLFEPDDEIKVVIECLDESLDGIKAKISVRSEQTDFDKRGYVTLDSSLPYNTFDFSSDKNGIFTVAIKLSDATIYSIFRECLRKGVGIELNVKTINMTDKQKEIFLRPYIIAKEFG